MMRLLLAFLLLVSGARATTKYVDSAASGSPHDGSTWSKAWVSPADMTSLAAGDIVEISGGGTGNTLTYNLAGNWAAVVSGASAGSRITYRIGQDGVHNGTVIFHSTANGVWVSGKSNVTISGDAGDGAMHFQVTGYAGIIEGTAVANVKMEYVDVTTGGGVTTEFNNFQSGCTGIEMSHCSFTVTSTTCDRGGYGSFAGTGYDDSSIHHCTIVVPTNTNGIGADALEYNGSGWSIYNCTITANVTGTYAGSQHCDGEQCTGGNVGGSGPAQYIKIYNNSFRDIANYCVYLEGVNGGFQHVMVYNNICQMTNSAMQGDNVIRGIVAIPNASAGAAYDDVTIANNLVADYTGTHHAIELQSGGVTGTFTNCTVSNNTYINGGAVFADNAVTAANNVGFTSGQAAGKFTSYTASSSSNNYNLTASATTLIGQGSTLSSFFTIDYAGTTRVVPWDIGPYKYALSINVNIINATTFRFN